MIYEPVFKPERPLLYVGEQGYLLFNIGAVRRPSIISVQVIDPIR